MQLTMVDKRIQQMTDKLSQTIEFSSRLVKYASPTEVMVFKQLLETRLQLFLAFNPDVSFVFGDLLCFFLDYFCQCSLNALF